MKYTQGPWKVSDYNEEYQIVTDCPDEFFIADINMDNNKAGFNAELIAAAPEMKDLIDLGYHLSMYAAASKKNNTEEFLEGLFKRVCDYQEKYEKLIRRSEGDNS